MLWIKLNAERIQYSQKILNNKDEELGSIDESYSHMWVSKNQLEYDETNCDAPRFSFEELLTNTPHELFKLSQSKNFEKIQKLFESFKIKNPRENEY